MGCFMSYEEKEMVFIENRMNYNIEDDIKQVSEYLECLKHSCSVVNSVGVYIKEYNYCVMLYAQLNADTQLVKYYCKPNPYDTYDVTYLLIKHWIILHSPIYCLITHKHKHKILKKIPMELFRYLQSFVGENISVVSMSS